jgi:anti-sigma factor RsiW
MATPIDDDTLQRFYDGDLTPLEEHGVQARIEADPAAQQRLAELGRLTELMREAADELGSSVHSSGLFAAIETQLKQQTEVGFGARFKVISSEWLEHRRASLVPLVAATAVAAATLVAVVRPAPPAQLPRLTARNEAPVVAPAGPATEATQPTEVEPEALAQAHGSRVENVDFGASTGTVFEIDNEGVAVAVVWITDDEELP